MSSIDLDQLFHNTTTTKWGTIGTPDQKMFEMICTSTPEHTVRDALIIFNQKYHELMETLEQVKQIADRRLDLIETYSEDKKTVAQAVAKVVEHEIKMDKKRQEIADKQFKTSDSFVSPAKQTQKTIVVTGGGGSGGSSHISHVSGGGGGSIPHVSGGGGGGGSAGHFVVQDYKAKVPHFPDQLDTRSLLMSTPISRDDEAIMKAMQSTFEQDGVDLDLLNPRADEKDLKNANKNDIMLSHKIEREKE